MTVTLFAPTNLSPNTIYQWDSTVVWSTRTVPNSATSVVEFPLVGSPAQATYYEVQIQAGESFTVGSAILDGGELISFGTLTVRNEMEIGANGSFGTFSTGGTSTLDAGSLENGGSISSLGQFNIGGDLLNRGTLTGTGLTISAGTFENTGVLATGLTGDLTISAGSGGLANLSGGTLTGGSYLSRSGETIFINANGPITTLAAVVEASGAQQGQLAGDLETYGATGTAYVSLRSSLTGIAPSGVLGVQVGSYALSQAVTVAGAIALDWATLVAPGLSVASTGTITSGGNGTLSVSGTITDNGSIVAALDSRLEPSSLAVGAPVIGSGSLVVGPGQGVNYGRSSAYIGVTLELTGADSAKVVFADNGGTLRLDAPQSFTGSIEGFTKGDQIVLYGISRQSVTGLSYSGDATQGVLTVQETGGASLSLSFLGSHSTAEFALASSSAGTVITDTATAATAGASAAAAISAYQAGTFAVGTVITDSAANVAAHLDMLETLKAAGQIGPIVLTDFDTVQIGTVSYNSLILPPILTVTAGQAIADGNALQDIAGAYTLSVTGASVQQAEQLAGTAHITSIAVSDSLAAIQAQLDQLEALAATGQVSTIAVTGSAVATLSLSAGQFQADHVALADMTGNFDVLVTAAAASQSLTGVAGHGTTVVLSGAAASYAITPTGDGIGLTASGADSYTLRDVSALQFSDVTEIVAAAPGSAGAVTTGNVTELYGAVFGREPDVGGLAYYRAYLAANPATPLTNFAQWFLASPEYVNNPAHDYAQSSAGDAQFISDSYQNLLHRTPTTDEVTYYQSVIAPYVQGVAPGTTAYANAEAQAHALVLTYFSQSPEFLGDVQVTAAHPASAQHWLLLI